MSDGCINLLLEIQNVFNKLFNKNNSKSIKSCGFIQQYGNMKQRNTFNLQIVCVTGQTRV